MTDQLVNIFFWLTLITCIALVICGVLWSMPFLCLAGSAVALIGVFIVTA